VYHPVWDIIHVILKITLRYIYLHPKKELEQKGGISTCKIFWISQDFINESVQILFIKLCCSLKEHLHISGN